MPQRSQGIKTSNYNSLSKLDESSGTGESQHAFLKYKLKGLGTYSPGLDHSFYEGQDFFFLDGRPGKKAPESNGTTVKDLATGRAHHLLAKGAFLTLHWEGHAGALE